jgi:segregation and condensation protein B
MIEPRDVLEALLFASEAPVEPTVIRDVLDLPSPDAARELVDELRRHLDAQGRVLQIVEVGGGFRMVTRPDVAPWLVKLARSKTKSRLSRPALETLAIIAYRQPVSRPEVDATRGVNSEGVLDNLLERRLIRISGRKETAGRPFLYETTREFLVAFGLRDLGDLPKVDGDLVIIDSGAPPEAPTESDAAAEPDASDIAAGQTPGDVTPEASAAADEIDLADEQLTDIDEAAVGAALAADADAPARRVAEPLDAAEVPARDVAVPAHLSHTAAGDTALATPEEAPWEPGEVPTTPSAESVDHAGNGDAPTASAPRDRGDASAERDGRVANDEGHDDRGDTSGAGADSAHASGEHTRQYERAGDRTELAGAPSDAGDVRASRADATSADAAASASAVSPPSGADETGDSDAADSPQQDPGSGGPGVAPRR